MGQVTVRYIVDDVEAAIDFYTSLLEFEVRMRPALGFALLERGSLLLALSNPGTGGGGQTMPDGTLPEPGGWNRFQIQVEDLAATVERLKEQGVNFRNEILAGKGGKQILLEDPAGNAIELFEPNTN